MELNDCGFFCNNIFDCMHAEKPDVLHDRRYGCMLRLNSRVGIVYLYMTAVGIC